MSKTIFITGASRGFGRIWAEAFLKRGDKVVATARNKSALDELADKYGNLLLPIALDVNNRNDVFNALAEAKKHFGTIDVVINNAGYGLIGTIEENTEKEIRDQFETNVFGLLWVTQAALPIMREQGHGHIIQLSSVLGIATLPVLGIYNATKFAVEGLSESLAQEVKGFGINITLVEPNGFSTDWAGSSAVHSKRIDAYDTVRAGFEQGMSDTDSFGDPEATSGAILQLIDAQNPPLRLFLGKVAFPWVQQVYADRLQTWEDWAAISAEAHGKNAATL